MFGQIAERDLVQGLVDGIVQLKSNVVEAKNNIYV